MTVQFKPATRRQLKVKLGLMGTAGTGKTWTSLSIAEALAIALKSKVCVIDSERGRAEAYAGDFAFDHFALQSYAPEAYIDALSVANDEGYDPIVVDGISPEWMGRDGILASVDRFGGWKEATPRHDAFVDTLFRIPRNVLVTMRAKTQYSVSEVPRDGGGTRQIIEKLGVGPVQRDNLEYEFDLLGMMELDHSITLHKSVIASLPSGSYMEPSATNSRTLGREIAAAVLEWINTGEEVATPVEADDGHIAYLRALLNEEGFDDDKIDAQFKKRRLELGALTQEYVETQIGEAETRLTSKSVDIAPIQAKWPRESARGSTNGDAATTTSDTASAEAEALTAASESSGEKAASETP